MLLMYGKSVADTTISYIPKQVEELEFGKVNARDSRSSKQPWVLPGRWRWSCSSRCWRRQNQFFNLFGYKLRSLVSSIENTFGIVYMRIPYSLLKKCLAEEIRPEQIEKALLEVGIEVDSTIVYEPSFRGVIVGQVVETMPHPNADRLKLAKVDTGKGFVDLVCGASNCRKGLLVAFAQEGAVLGEGKKALHIKKSVIREVESCGMLCSEKELGFSEESEGIIELDHSFVLGEDLKKRFSDVIFELSLTPNLGYCFSVEGIAKEVCRATGIEFIPWNVPQYVPSEKRSYKITVAKSSLCPRYGYAVFDQVAVQPSSLEQRLLLSRCGFSAINSVVDASNLVMLLLGQPLHCFDVDKLPAKEIEVREGTPSETLALLDSRTITLSPKALLITSQGTPLALAGVMGGRSTAISDTTTSVFVESAYFDPKAVRRSRKATETNTEASRRFERGVDPNCVERALCCFQDLLPAHLKEQAVVGARFPDRKILLRESRVRSLLGIDVSIDEIEMSLRRSFLTWSEKEASQFLVCIPPARHDLLEETDLVEEVIKTIGYSRMTSEPRPAPYIPSSLRDHHIYEAENWARHVCVNVGLQEWVTCDLISPMEVEEIGYAHIPPQDIVHLANPLSIEQSIVRPSLLPGLLSSFEHNYVHQEGNVQAFEVGNIFLKHGGKYMERLALGVLMSGARLSAYFGDTASEVDFFDMKGILEQITDALHLNELEVRPSHLAHFHPGRQATVFLAQQQVGMFGEVHPMLLKKRGILKRVFCMELDLQELYAQADRRAKQAMPLALYPSMERDWTVTLPVHITYKELLDVVTKDMPNMVEAVNLVSLFTSEQLGANKKNMTLRFRFRDREKTLVQEEVDACFAKIVHAASLAFGLQ